MLHCPPFILHVNLSRLASADPHYFHRGLLFIVFGSSFIHLSLTLSLAYAFFQIIFLLLNPEIHLFSFYFEKRTLGPANRLSKSFWVLLLLLYLGFYSSCLCLGSGLPPSQGQTFSFVMDFSHSLLLQFPAHISLALLFLRLPSFFFLSPWVLPLPLYLKNINTIEAFILPCCLHRPFSSCWFSFQY